MDLDVMAQMMKLWPIFLGFITLVIVLAKMHANIQVLEEKVKVAFQLINKLNDRKKIIYYTLVYILLDYGWVVSCLYLY